MRIWHNTEHALHAGREEMYRGRMVPCHEVPERLGFVLAELLRRGAGPIEAPTVADAELDAAIARIHDPRYLHTLATAWDDWVAMDPANAGRDALPSVWPLPNAHGFRADRLPENAAARLGLFAFDSGSPLMAGTWRAARAGAACALAAARTVLVGQRSAFALTRPPGHHAGPAFFGGYCFLNNGAIAAQALRDGGHDKVAVLDIDYHHGNGTQTIFYERADVLTLSIHGDPRTEYPFFLGHADETGAGEGTGFNRNWALPRGTGLPAWRQALDEAMAAVRTHGATALVVPMGLDTFEGDPISGFRLRTTDYAGIGAALAGLSLPTVFTFEGGYAVSEVGVNAAELLGGFERAA
ncbi:MAG: histone deacetylase family protein [Hydrogenophaga sp.]|uniref:histone deacetylase family protein n=1 Tax=Hydrogenophaga sp. TaxID=1904254 RepID=UPI001DF3CAA2|nr:histone deacetylase family protein [Hydrogenophaga sp.]MBX3610097.1 histone deacetylase family protein [Hydrogenophaga sp.]